MPRKPKAKNTLSAGERVALYEAELAKKNSERSEIDAPFTKETPISYDRSVRETPLDEKKELPASESVLKGIKRNKQKPKSATVRVDFSLPTGTVKPMHGMCNGPVSYGADIGSLFKEIGVPLVRFDCTDTAAGGYAVDVSRIFKDFNNDPADPTSYDFACTDMYVGEALASGAKVIFRLGESRDLFGALQPVRIFEDEDVLARVCVNIIRHYNDGWAYGAHYGIEYFEILSSSGDVGTDAPRYGRLANLIKLYDEKIKVGGMCFENISCARDFLRICKKHRYPIDFLTLESFLGDVERAADELGGIVAFAKNLGFADLEFFVGKWMFADKRVSSEEDIRKVLAAHRKNTSARCELVTSQRSVVGGAYAAAWMLRMNALDGVSAACFFDAQPAVSPFCSLTDDLGIPQKPFYAFKAFGELYRAKNNVLCTVDRTEGFSHSGIYAAAALSDGGEGVVLLASFEGCGVIDLRLDGVGENHYFADVYMLDGVKNMELVDSVPVAGAKKRLVLNVSEYGAVLIKLH